MYHVTALKAAVCSHFLLPLPSFQREAPVLFKMPRWNRKEYIASINSSVPVPEDEVYVDDLSPDVADLVYGEDDDVPT